MPKTMSKPPLASYTPAKMVVLAVGSTLGITLLIWAVDSLTTPYAGDPDLSFSIAHVLMGMIWLAAAFYSRWAWQPRRKHGHWHRWTGAFVQAVYVCILLLLASLASWKATLHSFFPLAPPVWRQIGNAILVGLFALAWALPVISYALARRLEDAQERLDFKLLALSGGAPAALMVLAGILGADYGLHGGDEGIAVGGLLFSVCAVGLSQYWATYMWRHRPWAKDEGQ